MHFQREARVRVVRLVGLRITATPDSMVTNRHNSVILSVTEGYTEASSDNVKYEWKCGENPITCHPLVGFCGEVIYTSNQVSFHSQGLSDSLRLLSHIINPPTLSPSFKNISVGGRQIIAVQTYFYSCYVKSYIICDILFTF